MPDIDPPVTTSDPATPIGQTVDPTTSDPATPIDLSKLDANDWLNILKSDDRFKDNPVALNTKNPLDAMEQLVNANKLIGEKRLAVPQEGWTEEQFGEFFSKLGRPASPDGYKYENVPEIEGWQISEEFTKKTNEALHKAGLTPAQYTTVMDTFYGWLKNTAESSSASSAASREATEAALKKEYGTNYEGKVQEANAVLAEFGSRDLVEYLETTGLGNHPSMVRMMVKIAEKFSDDSAIGESIRSNLSTENRAMQKIASLKSDPAFQKKIFDPMAPGHKEALAQWTELHKQAYPEK